MIDVAAMDGSDFIDFPDGGIEVLAVCTRRLNHRVNLMLTNGASIILTFVDDDGHEHLCAIGHGRQMLLDLRAAADRMLELIN